jgi:hypothetical protein
MFGEFRGPCGLVIGNFGVQALGFLGAMFNNAPLVDRGFFMLFGHFVANSDNHRLEIVRLRVDVPESGPDRKHEVHRGFETFRGFAAGGCHEAI